MIVNLAIAMSANQQQTVTSDTGLYISLFPEK
jgi:hypothetical protein